MINDENTTIEINIGSLGFNVIIDLGINHKIYFKTKIHNDMDDLYKHLNIIFKKEIRKNKLKDLY